MFTHWSVPINPSKKKKKLKEKSQLPNQFPVCSEQAVGSQPWLSLFPAFLCRLFQLGPSVRTSHRTAAPSNSTIVSLNRVSHKLFQWRNSFQHFSLHGHCGASGVPGSDPESAPKVAFWWLSIALSGSPECTNADGSCSFFSPCLYIQRLRKSWWLSKPRSERVGHIPRLLCSRIAGSVQCRQSRCLWLRLGCWDNCAIFKCTVLLNAAGKCVISSAVQNCTYHWLKWTGSILCSTLDCGWNGGGMSTATTGHVALRWGKDFKI